MSAVEQKYVFVERNFSTHCDENKKILLLGNNEHREGSLSGNR